MKEAPNKYEYADTDRLAGYLFKSGACKFQINCKELKTHAIVYCLSLVKFTDGHCKSNFKFK